MVRLTPNGLSVSERQRAISLVRSSGVGCVSAVMKPSAPALATAATSSARPTHCMPPCTIGCSTPTSSVNRVLIIVRPCVCAARRCRRARQMSTGAGVVEQCEVSALAGVAPGFVPVLSGGIDDAAVGLEELVGDLEYREHQAAFGTPCDVTAALFAPDEFAGLAFDAFGRTFLVDEAALEHVSLLDVDVLVVGQHRAWRKPHQRGHQAGGAVEQQRLGLTARKPGLLPLHAVGANHVRVRVGSLPAFWRHG